MCTICTCLSTSRSGSPISRMVTSQPPHMANHSSASRAAMLHLPTGLELVVLRSGLLRSVMTCVCYCVRYDRPPLLVRHLSEHPGQTVEEAETYSHRKHSAPV